MNSDFLRQLLGRKKQEAKKQRKAPVRRQMRKPFATRDFDASRSEVKISKLTPRKDCLLKVLKFQRVHDMLLLEGEYLANMAGREKELKAKEEEETLKIDDLRRRPLAVVRLVEIFEDHAIVNHPHRGETYVPILSFVDNERLEPNATVLVSDTTGAVVGVLQEGEGSNIHVLQVTKSPTETYQDIGGLESQIQEIKEAVELPLTRPELYEDMGIKPPKGVILYGPPGTGKTLVVKAVANQTSATFLRISGSELVQKYLGDGPKLVRDLFLAAERNAPSIVFIDEIDAVGTKRYDSNSSGEKEIQRTMLELLNQLDGFDTHSNVKVIMATNRIETLDPALIRPGRIDRKIEFPPPDENTKRHIFQIHTSKMNLAKNIDIDDLILGKDNFSGADIKAICSEAGLLALRDRRLQISSEDFKQAKEKVLLIRNKDRNHNMYM